MFKKSWVYHGLARFVENEIQNSIQASIHTARALACLIRRAAGTKARNFWPSPFSIPGVEDLARWYREKRDQGGLEIVLRGDPQEVFLVAEIIRLADPALEIKVEARTGERFSLCCFEICVLAKDCAPALLALQIGIAFKLASHPWFDQTLAVIDLETTGLSPREARITEYGIVLIKNEREIERQSSLVNPGQPIPPEITRLTGISDELVASAPQEGQALGELLPLIEKADLIGGHNYRDFDEKFLLALSERVGLPLPSKPKFDTLDLARKFFFGQPNNKQPILLDWLGWDSSGAHRALADVLGCAQILKASLRAASGAERFLQDALPLVLIALDRLEEVRLGEGLRTIADLFPRDPKTPLELQARLEPFEFCVRLNANEPGVKACLAELTELLKPYPKDSLTLLLEEIPKAWLKANSDEGFALDHLDLTIADGLNFFAEAQDLKVTHFDLIIRLDSSPPDSGSRGETLDWRANPLTSR